ncbi:hypothetical protein FUAX_20020 [Fulvitalea axinellae]|uniref:4-hydroxybenzoate polyprenyltransferase n=1 Tax=Fulvitalea axinellae TaxID=1182444 RepID=A0AAU9DB09_9BACT|nr:hypothetical protein FUAX_20020 [Fulvitalea axinellae]
MKKTRKVGDSSVSAFFALVRWPNLLMIALTQFMVARFLIDIPAEEFEPVWAVIASTVIVAAAGYMINDYYDVKIDYVNRPDSVIIGKYFSRRAVLFAHTLFNAVAIVLAGLYSWKQGGVIFFMAFCLWWYSNDLKRRPLGGNLMVAFLIGLSMMMMLLFSRNNEKWVFVYTFFAVFMTLIREILKDIEDMKGDASFGCRTLPVVYGLRPARRLVKWLVLVFTAGLGVFAFRIGNGVVQVYFAVFVPLLLLFYMILAKADTKRDFGVLSRFSKVLMALGILSMIFH